MSIDKVKPESIINQMTKDLSRIEGMQPRNIVTTIQGNSETFVTSESIGSGDPVVISGDGTVQSAFGKSPIYAGIEASSLIVNTRFNRIIAMDRSDSAYWIGAMNDDDTTITWSILHGYEGGGGVTKAFYIHDRIIIFNYKSISNRRIGTLQCGTFGSVSEIITFGTPVTVFDVTTQLWVYYDCIYAEPLDRLIIAYIVSLPQGQPWVVRLVIAEIDPINNTFTINPAIEADIGAPAYPPPPYPRYPLINLCYAKDVLVMFLTTWEYVTISTVGTIDIDTNTVKFYTLNTVPSPFYGESTHDPISCSSVYDSTNDRIIVVFTFSHVEWFRGIAVVCKVGNSKDRLLYGTEFLLPYTGECKVFLDKVHSKVFITSAGNENMHLTTLVVNPLTDTFTQDSSFSMRNGNSHAEMVYHPASGKMIHCDRGGYYKVLTITSPFRSPYQFIGIANESRNVGENISVSMFGINNKQSGLTPGLVYYLGENSLTTDISEIKIGRALNATTIKVANPVIIYQ